MKIAFVSSEFITEKLYDGGLANYLARTALCLSKLGHRVTVIVSSTKDESLDWNGITVRRVKVGGAPLFFLDGLLSRLRGPIDWLYEGWKLGKAVKDEYSRESFDIIQYASFKAPGIFRMKDVPSVVRLSSYEPMLWDAWGVELTVARRIQKFVEQQGLMRADALFGPSQLIVNAVKKFTGRQATVIEPIYVPYDGPIDETPYKELLVDKPYLLFYGSIGRLKGVATIAETIEPLLASHPEMSFVFIGKDVGDQGRPMMQHVWESAGRHRGRVLFLGKMHRSQLLPFIRNALAVVLPSRMDNLPNTCIESMAEGKVVIGTEGTSFEQLIEDGTNGLLCEVDNAEGLRAAIEKVLNDVSLADAMGVQARKHIEDVCGENAIQRLLGFYDSVIDKGVKR